MDDRYLFFSLSDADFFEVPWAGPAEPSLCSGADQPRYRQVGSGPWVMHLPDDVALPESGWKIHVSALPDTLRATAEVIARCCAQERTAWKIIRSASLVQATQGKYAPRAISGKVAVVYPRDESQLVRLVSQLATALEGMAAPRIHGDHHHPDAPIGLRWGAFQEKWIEAADGRTVPGASTEDGPVADDRSSPARHALPADLEEVLVPRRPVAPLPITRVRVVHRSNAGALYDARLRDGRRVALKEARHHAALGPEGSDAVARLRHEHAALRRLAGKGIAPEPIDYWELADSDLLVMTWVGDETLSQRVGRTHPAGRPGVDDVAAERFWRWVDCVTAELADLVGAMHGFGVAHGDVHPGNIVLGPAGPRLVDLEAASVDGAAVTCALGAPGFQLDESDPFARDLFGLARTCAHLRDPDVALVDRRPDLAAALAAGTESTATYDVPATVADMLDRLADDLLSRATPERTDRLFPGGTEQFTRPLGGHDLLSGAAGTMLALLAHGRAPSPTHLDWLARVPAAASSCRGLGEGRDGVALALARLGRPEQAAELFDGYPAQLPHGLGWARGRAGCALALTELSATLGREDLSERARIVLRELVDAIDDPERVLAGPGLLEGWSGIALALLRVRDLMPDESAQLTRAATAALWREHALLKNLGGALVGCPGGRIRVGLGHGSGAFALAVHALGDVDSDLSRAALSAVRAARTVRSPIAGLLEGLAGSAAVMGAYGELVTATEIEDRATWHCAPTARGWSVLGAQRMRCSDDLATGSAGLIAALGPTRAERLTRVLFLPVGTFEEVVDDSCHRPPLSTDTVAPVAAAL